MAVSWINQRQKETILWLIIATFANTPLAFFFPLAMFLFPILFATGLIITNYAYLKYKYSGAIILVLFFLIFLCGSPIFYQFGGDLGSEYLGVLSGGVSAVIMVIIVVRLAIKDITIGFFQIFMIFLLGFVSSSIAYFLQQKFSFSTTLDGISGYGFIYQIFMSLAIAMTLKKSEPHKSMYNLN